MDIAEALEIVLLLAKSATSIWQDEDEHKRHLEAIAIVTDMAVNQFGDD